MCDLAIAKHVIYCWFKDILYEERSVLERELQKYLGFTVPRKMNFKIPVLRFRI
jgi:hypothetical protein